MKRKLIKQGKGGYTVTIPIAFVREFNLNAGDELDFSMKNGGLTIIPDKIKIPKREITLKSEKTESNVRTLLANAYRAGFDKIYLTYNGLEEVVVEIVKEHLLGFEMFKQKDGKYVIESVAEPSYDDFETIIQRQFHVILEIIRTVDETSLKNKAVMVQKYDNFLKRCISKKFFAPEAGPFFWQFISSLTQISRQCYHFNKDLLKKKKKLTPKEKDFLNEVEKMFQLLQKSYLRKDPTQMMELHNIQQKLFYEVGPKLLKKDSSAHYLIYLARLVYLANSPLTGCLEINLG